MKHIVSRSRHTQQIPLIRPGGDLVTGVKSNQTLQLGDLERHAVETTRKRMKLIMVLFVLIFAALGGRLIQLNTGDEMHARHQAEKNNKANLTRPMIVDRNGVLLATNIQAYTLGADARLIDDAETVTQKLAHIIPDLNQSRTRHYLATTRHHIKLKHGVTPRQYHAVLELGNPGLKMELSQERVYPHGASASHVVGFVNDDKKGLRGLERALDEALVMADERAHVQTTLDIRVQHAVRAELQKGVERFAAIGGAALVMDVTNGDILAMVSLPDFDPNHPTLVPEASRFNRNTQGLYEVGSIFKIFTAAMALESKAVSVEQKFQTSEPLLIGKHTIEDDHGQERPLTTHEIVTYSSNVGSAQLALSVPPDVHRAFFERLGLMNRPFFDLPETTDPQLPAYWSDIHRVTISYGYGMNVSPLQVVAAGAAMVNGGIYYEPRLVANGSPLGVSVISDETSKYMREMMRDVVVSGTASQGDVVGYPVLGKTGTAEKQRSGGYAEDANISSFFGAFPAHKPRYAFIVMLDEPQIIDSTPRNTAGWNAVPVSARIVERIAPLLGLMPLNQDERLRLARFEGEGL